MILKRSSVSVSVLLPFLNDHVMRVIQGDKICVISYVIAGILYIGTHCFQRISIMKYFFQRPHFSLQYYFSLHIHPHLYQSSLAKFKLILEHTCRSRVNSSFIYSDKEFGVRLMVF